MFPTRFSSSCSCWRPLLRRAMATRGRLRTLPFRSRIELECGSWSTPGPPNTEAPFRFAPDAVYRYGAGLGDYMFTSISRGVLLGDGSAAVFDIENGEVVLVGADGRSGSVLAREGEGPGAHLTAPRETRGRTLASLGLSVGSFCTPEATRRNSFGALRTVRSGRSCAGIPQGSTPPTSTGSCSQTTSPRPRTNTIPAGTEPS